MAGRKKEFFIDPPTARLLDANLNRAREGLRVVEDAARFIWNDTRLTFRLRRLRHQLKEVANQHYRKFLEARDTAADSGRTIKEISRPSVEAVVTANMKRVQEAVRVLEEYSKVFSPRAAGVFKTIRFQLYKEEKRCLNHL